MASAQNKSSDDDALLQRVRDGDDAALSILIQRYQSHVYRFGMKMCRNHEDAEDVLQETLIAAARTMKGFRGASSMSTWFYSIARSFCIKKRRKSKFAPAREESLEQDAGADVRALADPGRSPEEHLQAAQLEQALKDAISSLDDKYREILILRDVEGLTAPEVAEVTELSVAAVKSRLHRARAQLRDAMGPILEMDTPVPPQTGEQCPKILEMFSQNLEGEISTDLCAEMQVHVNGCAHCQATCSSLNRVLSVCKASPTPEVPERIQTAVRMSIQDLLKHP
jgi:RNA polymerase sigma-70 factor (ECF subfamily)